MNGRWNLEVIYKGFDDPAWLQDFENLQNMLRDFCAFAENIDSADPAVALPENMKRQEEIESLIMKMGTYANLRQSQDTRDGDAGSQMGRLMAAYSTVAAPIAKVEKWISNIPNLVEIVEGDPTLRSYAFLLSNTVRDSKYLLPGKGEEIMARLKLSGGSAWSDMQSYLTATVPVSYRGEKTNLSSIRNLAYDPDPTVRKDAYEAELAAYDRIRDAVAFALNSIKLETISDCRLRGYASPLDRTLERSFMKKETLEAMLCAMDDYLPKFWQYLKAKAKALGYEKGLPWYELFAPMGKSSTKFTAEQARDYLVSLYSGFDMELANMVAEAFDNDWIDFYPREGKVGGAFCAGVDAIGESRILTNFDGSFSDVVTLAHELGHAFHNLCIREHRPLNKDYSMPVAETASTFNECVVMASAIEKAADKEERIALIESQLQDATQIICDIYSRYRFETMVFENREDKFMDADTLCGFMLDAQRQSYGDGLDENCQHPYMWVCKSHYYGPTFYNFPYAFGGLFARGLYAQYEKEGERFIPKYKKLLYTTPIATAEDTALVADIDLTDKVFWASALQQIADQIDLFCQLLEE
ncbi:MAG: peptidase M3 [Ruminococcaceae bacterium]|nr:peptidase M3 [Oscillospiraceae bacterium]